MGSATECFHGTINLPKSLIGLESHELPHEFFPTTKCVPDEGICFTGLTQSKGVQVASFGCWPKQAEVYSNGLAWYGTPECKNEVNRLLCLCLSSLCNNFLPDQTEFSPQLEDTQAILVISLFILAIILVFCCTWHCLCLFCKKYKISLPKSQAVYDLEKGVVKNITLENPMYNMYPTPPPLMRMCSAPATMVNSVHQGLGSSFVLPALKLKESFKNLENIGLPQIKKKRLPRKETEV